MRKPKKFDKGQFIREVARERLGPVKSTKAIKPKTAKKPKYKEKLDED